MEISKIKKGDASMSTKTKDTATTRRNDVRKNSNTHYSTSYTRSAIPTDEEIAKEWMIREFGFWFERRTITPDMARDILENGGLNRKIKPTVMSKYLTDMKDGRWYFTPSAIWFDENGKLMDGQHRLKSVIELGKPVDFVVAFGVNRLSPVDINKPRSTADNLLFSGRISEAVADGDCTSTVNAMIKLKGGGAFYNSCSDFVKEKALNKYEDQLLKVKGIAQAGKNHPIMRKADIRAVLVFALEKGYDEDFLYKFAKTVNTGLPAISNETPPLVLRRTLEELDLTRLQMASVVEQAIVDCRAGRSRRNNYNPNKGLPISGDITIKEVLS